MSDSAVDATAIVVAASAGAVIAGVLHYAVRGDDARRGWVAAATLFGGLVALGAADLMRHSPRETQFLTVVIGVALPVLGTLGLVRGTRRVRAWLRVLLAFLTATLLLFGGFLLGAVLSRWLPF